MNVPCSPRRKLIIGRGGMQICCTPYIPHEGSSPSVSPSECVHQFKFGIAAVSENIKVHQNELQEQIVPYSDSMC